MKSIVLLFVLLTSVCFSGQPVYSPSGSSRLVEELRWGPSGSARNVVAGFIGDSSGRAQQWWPATPPVTVTAPSYSGGGQVNAGSSGSITLYGSASSDGAAVTYEVVSRTNITSISPTTNIANNGTVSFTVANLSSSGAYTIVIRARNANGILSQTITVSGTVYVAPPQPSTLLPWKFTPFEGVPSLGFPEKLSQSITMDVNTTVLLEIWYDSGRGAGVDTVGATATRAVTKGSIITIESNLKSYAGHNRINTTFIKINGTTVISWTNPPDWIIGHQGKVSNTM